MPVDADVLLAAQVSEDLFAAPQNIGAARPPSATALPFGTAAHIQSGSFHAWATSRPMTSMF